MCKNCYFQIWYFGRYRYKIEIEEYSLQLTSHHFTTLTVIMTMSKDNKPLRITVHKKIIALSENGEQEYIKGMDHKDLVARKVAIRQTKLISEEKSGSGAARNKTSSLPLSSSSTRVTCTQNPRPQLLVSVPLRQLLFHRKLNTEIKKRQSEITNSGFKRKRQSDDETVEESNEKRIKYVTYHI